MISIRRRAADFAHGVVRIVQDIEEHLLQLVRIADNLGQVLVEMLDAPRRRGC